MTRAVSSLQRESQVERSGREFTVPGPFSELEAEAPGESHRGRLGSLRCFRWEQGAQMPLKCNLIDFWRDFVEKQQ